MNVVLLDLKKNPTQFTYTKMISTFFKNNSKLKEIIQMFIKKNIYRAWFLRINNLFLFKVTETEANDFATNIPKKNFIYYTLSKVGDYTFYLKRN